MMNSAASISRQSSASATSPPQPSLQRAHARRAQSSSCAQITANQLTVQACPAPRRSHPAATRADIGRTYEDFIVGHIYEHRPGRTITEADNVWFTLLTMNQHPLHFDTAYAAETEFKKPLVNSCLTLSIVTGMSVADVSQKAIANLGWSKVELTAPVFVGDTIYAESEVLSKRPSQGPYGSGPRHRAHARHQG